MNELALPIRPALAPELAAELERVLTGPVRLPGIHEDDPGFRLPAEPAIYHPDAQREADARRAALGQPADPQVVRLWAQSLAAGNSNAPRSAGDFTAWVSALVFTCGDDLPGAVWDAATLRQAMRAFAKYWPNAGEVFDLLAAEAARMRAEVAALDAIAGGQPAPRGPAREAFGYELPPAPPERPAHPSMPKHDDDPAADLVRIDPAEVARKLAEFGPVDMSVDLLAARRNHASG
jgi:hypothetical protein